LNSKIEAGDEGLGYPGFYEEKIIQITMLGDGHKLEWELTSEGIRVKLLEKTCDHAWVLK
jgi:hypothetical protein